MNGAIKKYMRENNIQSPMALIGFITSILGFFVIPYFFGAVSIVLGVLALQQVKINKKGKTQATIAVILGIIDIIGSAFVQGFLLSYFS